MTRSAKKPVPIVRDSGDVADFIYSDSTKKKSHQKALQRAAEALVEPPKLTVRLLTFDEHKLVKRLKEEREWDPDIRALIAILESLEPRWTEAMSTLNVLDETEKLLKKARISNVVFDVFGSGKVGVCRRTGLFGSGLTLKEAFRHVQIVDDKSLRTVTREE